MRARKAAHATPCAAATLGVSRTHARLSPCTAHLHRAIVKTTYYQNASRAGGTALAAYPEVRLRYGVASRVELFYDAPSEIAKSGVAGAGIYTMTHVGIGAKLHLADLGNVSVGLAAESHPPPSALANTELVPLSDVHLAADWSGAHAMQYTAAAGVLNYATSSRASSRCSTWRSAAFSTSREIVNRTTSASAPSFTRRPYIARSMSACSFSTPACASAASCA